MATGKQTDANRLNVQYCKARSSQNALKTRLYSRKEAIVAESREDYEALIAEYV